MGATLPRDDFTILGPLAYAGKEDCQSGLCRSMLDGNGGWKCIGWHCAYCDEPCGSQGHRCEAADAVLGEARRVFDEQRGDAS